MTGAVRTIASVFRKDALSVWPLAALSAGLLVLNTYYAVAVADAPYLLSTYLPAATWLCAGLLIVALVQTDSPASDRLDWLTRPIPPAALLAAKAAFVTAALLSAATISAFAFGVVAGYAPVEALARATAPQWPILIAMIALTAIAAMTATMIQAGAAMMAIAALVLTVPYRVAQFSEVGQEIVTAGILWLPYWGVSAMVFASAVVALWLAYWRRAIRAARTLVAVAILAAILAPSVAFWPVVFGAQRALSADSSAAQPVALTLGTIATLRVDPPAEGERSAVSNPSLVFSPFRPLSAELWTTPERREAGGGAVAISTPIIPSGAPDGWLLIASRARATVEGAGGEDLLDLEPHRDGFIWISGRDDGSALPHAWLMPAADYQRGAERGARLRIDYSLSLLRPRAEAVFAADGVTRNVPGFGHCSAMADGATVRAVCFKRGPQPALVTAELVGDASAPVTLAYPDFTPGFLELLDGREYANRLQRPRGEGSVSVRVIAYDDRAHFRREIAAPWPPPAR